ncbi:HAMP domain-containing sensor histidine kinase [Nocardioides sp.]|uniref:sensor histidine kinase n=1 Tax=Nocardioides sp. TaxID=35761 RepID=UPI0031FEB218|nr:arlS [Nocardioides sp.]
MRVPRPGSFRQQIVILTTTVTAFAMLLLTLVLQLLLTDLSSRDVERVLEDRADAVVSSVETASTDTQLVIPGQQLDAGVAVYDASGTLVGGSAPESLREEYEKLSTHTVASSTGAGEANRVRVQPFRTSGGLDGVVIVTERLAPYEEAEHYALLVSLVTGLITTAAAGLIAAWISRRALAPVAAMARTATDWSEHDLGRRFDPGPPTNELSALAGTLDTLLDRVAAAIRSEQRLTSELAHELRTPLTTVQGTADLALLRDELTPEVRTDLTEISAAAKRMSATITTLLELARNEATLVEAAQCSLAQVVGEIVETINTDQVTVTVADLDIRLAVPHDLAVRALAPLLENAARLATASVLVSATVGRGRTADIAVVDDGPGVDIALADRIFEPGVTSGSGTGLGLAIARRVARTAGGELTLENPGPPTRFVLRLPVA